LARTLGELAAEFGCDLIGDPATPVVRVATLANADGESISFLANPAYRDQLQGTRAAAVILRQAEAGECPVGALVTDDPYLVYARVAERLHPEAPVAGGVHSSAVVAASATIAGSAEIGPNVTIEESAVVGERVYVGAGSVIGPRCVVGDDCRLQANVTLLRDVRMGKRCIVHPGAVLGSDGFGNAMSPGGWVKVPQVGSVRIGNDVEIGANSTIDRGAIDDTIIEDGVRIDNLVQIAHNVVIGAHTAMAAMSGISGSTVVGKRCMFAGQSGVVGHINICDDVVVGGATMISKDIREPGFYTGSFPADKDRDWKRKVARFRRLEDLVDRVKTLENKAKKNAD
jgi:UDP-3-O-[3-hydroxymyristoyl] glucosamine N-acyltransferase